MDSRQIETFLCVYEERNITRAAARLGLVQPAVSAQLRKIETVLGFRLFERTPRGLVPTAAGHKVYKLYLPVIRDLRAAQQSALELNGKTLGEISIGLTPTMTHTVLGNALKRYRARFPDVEIRVDENSSTALVDSVAAGQLDAAVITQRGARRGLAWLPLVAEELVLVRRKGGAAGPVRFLDIPFGRLILPKLRQGYRLLLDQAAEEAGFQITPFLEINSYAPPYDMIADSDLASIVPMVTARKAVQTYPLQICRIESPAIVRSVGAIHRERRPPSAKLSEFIALIGDEMRGALAPPGRRNAA